MKIEINANNLVVDGQEYSCILHDGEKHITVHQLSEISAYHHKTIRRKIREGGIHVIHTDNGRVLIPLKEFLRLVEEGKLIKYFSA